jgi:VanZ family protein
MALILWLSGERFSAEATGAVLTPVLHWLMPWASGVLAAVIHGGPRKLAHLTLSAVLALLWCRAFARGRGLPAATATPLAFAIAATWAGVDEGHQAVTLSRSGNVGDGAIDWAGAAIALVARRGWGGVV